MGLNVLAIKSAKPKEKRYLLKDEKGLYLEVMPTGSKFWRLRYWIDKKEYKIALGPYPEINLADARLRRDELRIEIAKGINPSEKRKEEKAQARGDLHFENVAREWAKKFAHTWTDGHAALNLRRLELNIFPYLGKKPISEITAPDLLGALRRIEQRGALEVARRVRGICSMVFRYALASGLVERDPAADLRGALAPPPVKHFASITEPKAVGQLLRDIDHCKASFCRLLCFASRTLRFCAPRGVAKC